MSRVRGASTTPPSDSTLADSTLERFREAVAGGHPTPAGVAVAAVSASFAFGLLAKALAVSGRKGAQSADPGRIRSLAAGAQTESSRMLQLAEDDVSAFKAFLSGTRLPQSTDRERLERRQAIDSALRQTIDVPLAGARSAAAGLQLCAEAASMTHAVVLADLAAAVTLLSGALRVFLLCAESNVGQLAKETSSYRERLTQESARCDRALIRGEEILEGVKTALQAADRNRPAQQPP